MAPKLCFGISGFSPQAGARMSWGSADLVPTSRPLRSEQALGSVVPSPILPPRLAVTLTPRGLLIQAEVSFRSRNVVRDPRRRALRALLDGRTSVAGHNMPLQMPHVSVWDSHSSLPQSKHCVPAVLEQGKPSASAEFLISRTSQCVGMGVAYGIVSSPFPTSYSVFANPCQG